MLRLNKVTDYGVILMVAMAGKPVDWVFSSRELAESTNLPIPMVSKILKILTQGGLLISRRGVQGGYSLAKPPARISVYEMLDLLEGPLALTQCLCGEEGGCDIESSCPVLVHWQHINLAVRNALLGVTLQDLTQPFDTGRLMAMDAIPTEV